MILMSETADWIRLMRVQSENVPICQIPLQTSDIVSQRVSGSLNIHRFRKANVGFGIFSVDVLKGVKDHSSSG